MLTKIKKLSLTKLNSIFATQFDERFKKKKKIYLQLCDFQWPNDRTVFIFIARCYYSQLKMLNGETATACFATSAAAVHREN